MALDPNFPTSPYVYVLYTYDHALELGGTGAALGHAGAYLGPVPDAARGHHRRLRRQRAPVAAARLRATSMTGSEQVLVEDWCQQYPSHSIGDARVRPRRRALRERRGRRELQLHRLGAGRESGNPCGDPPGGAGGH